MGSKASGVFQKISANLSELSEAPSIQDDYEQIVYCHDPKVGLKAIISIHNTALGPAAGGCRMWNYETEDQALTDVLRLSKGMTYKSAISNLKLGGGKAVIIGDAKKDKTRALLERYGEFVDRLGGHYITAKDVGIGSDDLKIVQSKTSHVMGIEGVRGSSGDPSPATAWGVYHGMKAAAEYVLGSASLKGVKIALQGLGTVAYYLLEHLAAEGAVVIGCDVESAAISRATQKYPVEIVKPESIYDVSCDIFSPSALGASVNRETLPRLRAKIIAGAANNQLATPEDGFELMRRGIVYAPDYAINAGGIINIYYERPEFEGYDRKKAYDHIEGIGRTIREILARSEEEKQPSHVIADRIATERVRKAERK